MSKHAEYLKSLEDWAGDARVYKLSEPHGGYDYVVVSAVVVDPFQLFKEAGPETYIFGSDSEGTVARYLELEGSFIPRRPGPREGLEQRWVLRETGGHLMNTETIKYDGSMKGQVLDPEFKRDWVAALRSGEYAQGQEELYDGSHYCCLGVAARLAGVPDSILRSDGNDQFLFELEVDPSIKGLTRGLQYHLAEMNDVAGMSFPEIATFIEENL